MFNTSSTPKAFSFSESKYFLSYRYHKLRIKFIHPLPFGSISIRTPSGDKISYIFSNAFLKLRTQWCNIPIPRHISTDILKPKSWPVISATKHECTGLFFLNLKIAVFDISHPYRVRSGYFSDKYFMFKPLPHPISSKDFPAKEILENKGLKKNSSLYLTDRSSKYASS